MQLRVGLNGIGRIGGGALRVIFNQGYDVEIAAINTSGRCDIENYAYQLRYDSTYGRFPVEVISGKAQKNGEIGRLIIGGKSIPVFGKKNPAEIPWNDYGVDVVLECTGNFNDRKALSHIEAGAKKVILSGPTKDKSIQTYVFGVNTDDYHGETLISNGSCTTNCVAPIVKLIYEKLGSESITFSTIHAFTNNQAIMDGGNGKDWRRGRAASENIVPTTSGAEDSIIDCYPKVAGRIGGIAIRVPVICGSYADIKFSLEEKTTMEKIVSLFNQGSDELKGIMKVTNEQLVSRDILGDKSSCIIDMPMMKIIPAYDKKGNHYRDELGVRAWYDNEYAYSCRLVEMAMFMMK